MKLDFEHGVVELAHGAGGRAQEILLRSMFFPAFGNAALNAGNDQAEIHAPTGRIVIATDSHVVTPLFFPGGDIGSLAVHGTLNDVVMSGARPLCLSAAFIIEEGFSLASLKRIVNSMAAAARRSGVEIVTGDTKVVARGQADGLYINTTGMGVIEHSATLCASNIQVGDRILINGTIGDHGMSIHSARQGFHSPELYSDSIALDDLVACLRPHIHNIRCMRDPTRGGLASALNEFAHTSTVGIRLYEDQLAISAPVRAHCEILGLDPLYLANEGKLVLVCDRSSAQTILMAMQRHPLGQHASIIGEVISDEEPFVEMTTIFGGNRLIDWRYADPLPRIC